MNENLILIAEDDGDVRELLSYAAEAAGFQAVSTSDGRSAARILTAARPVALITDVRMPEMDGIELCRLARFSGIHDTAIVMLSSNTHQHHIDAGIRAGADRYLPKPTTPRRLMTVVREIIAGKRSTYQRAGA